MNGQIRIAKVSLEYPIPKQTQLEQRNFTHEISSIWSLVVVLTLILSRDFSPCYTNTPTSNILLEKLSKTLTNVNKLNSTSFFNATRVIYSPFPEIELCQFASI